MLHRLFAAAASHTIKVKTALKKRVQKGTMPQKRKEQEKPIVRDGLDDQVDDLREPRERVERERGEANPLGGKGRQIPAVASLEGKA